MMSKLILKIKNRKNNFRKIGVKSIINKGVFFQPKSIDVGDYVYIGPGSKFHAGGTITIRDGVVIGPDVTIWTVNHDISIESIETLPYGSKVITKEVVIGRGCWIGTKVKITPGVHLGDGCIVAMGSVVTKSWPDFSIIGGNPAKIIKMRYKNDKEYYDLKGLLDNEKWYIKEKRTCI